VRIGEVRQAGIAGRPAGAISDSMPDRAEPVMPPRSCRPRRRSRRQPPGGLLPPSRALRPGSRGGHRPHSHGRPRPPARLVRGSGRLLAPGRASLARLVRGPGAHSLAQPRSRAGLARSRRPRRSVSGLIDVSFGHTQLHQIHIDQARTRARGRATGAGGAIGPHRGRTGRGRATAAGSPLAVRPMRGSAAPAIPRAPRRHR
jgi:hypothetical protein